MSLVTKLMESSGIVIDENEKMLQTFIKQVLIAEATAENIEYVIKSIQSEYGTGGISSRGIRRIADFEKEAKLLLTQAKVLSKLAAKIEKAS